MIQEVKVKEISTLDKKIMAQALDSYGNRIFGWYLNDSDNKDCLKDYSICQAEYHRLLTHLNTKKVLNMDGPTKTKPNKKWVLATHTALVMIDALRYYETVTNTYNRSRCDVIAIKIDKEIV